MSKKKKYSETSKANEPITPYGQGELSFDKVWLMFQETDKKMKETDKILSEKFHETDKKIKQLSELFTSQWGKLVESLVEGAVVRLFNEIGIDVHYTSERVKGKIGGENVEFDILAHNEKDLVVIEVKTTLRPKDVKKFLEKIKKFKSHFPYYGNHKIRGCVAFLTVSANVDIQAQNEGFYVIKATGDSASLVNPADFEARVF